QRRCIAVGWISGAPDEVSDRADIGVKYLGGRGIGSSINRQLAASRGCRRGWSLDSGWGRSLCVGGRLCRNGLLPLLGPQALDFSLQRLDAVFHRLHPIE